MDLSAARIVGMKSRTLALALAGLIAVSSASCAPSGSGADVAEPPPGEMQARPDDDGGALQESAPAVPGPVVYTGSGDDAVQIGTLDWGCVFHITGNQEGGSFSVRGYDANGSYVGLFVDTSEPYEGVTLDPVQETAVLEVSASGEWTIELLPVLSLDTISVGETVSGSGDSVLLISSFDTTATITGNEGRHYFSVRTYGTEGNELLVDTTDAYEGTVMLAGDPVFLEIKAVGEWTVTFDQGSP